MIQTKWLRSAFAASLLATTFFLPAKTSAQSDDRLTVPEPQREFRGAWIASVSNIDWPSSKGLTPEQQKKELIGLLDRVAKLNMNAVVLQVRPMADALYFSKYEPWSEYLTGKQGRAPSPYYDPLAFAVAEAHKRGLELHAWFNPYRAGLSSGKNFAPNHISKRRPDLVRKYGKYLWMDPGEIEVQQHSMNVILDVVRRYDIDAVHFDDYFYPYKENNAAGKPMDFPDEQSWQKYKKAGGKLGRDDWRRQSVNIFIERLSAAIKKQKPWVKFGISPFGIWRPNNPPGIKGLDSYSSLYADSRKWLAEGWVDYFAPQLYWNIDQKEQSYPVLQQWWVSQNAKKRHIWPGMSVARIGSTRGADEIARQIQLTRKQPGATGNIHWSIKAIMKNSGGLADILAKDLYTEPALIPASSWLSRSSPAKPNVSIKGSGSNATITWSAGSSVSKPVQWVVQQRVNGKWLTQIVPEHQRSLPITSSSGLPAVVAVRAVNRFGNASQPEIATVTR